jgi:GDPmannose 4,6-dehydratase
MFGHAEEVPQRETTRFHPRSAYGISKVAGFELTRSYRETYGLFAVSGILFNHESPRRGTEFVTRKITTAIARILAGTDSELRLGNISAKRDWGHAREYIEAMWLMLQQQEPRDYVIATGVSHSVQEFIEIAFDFVGLDYSKYLVVDSNLYRPPEVNLLVGDASIAKSILGWESRGSFSDLVHEMVQADCEAAGVPLRKKWVCA